MSEQYSMAKYAEELCKAVNAYDYPAVTYDFETEAFDYFRPERKIVHCRCTSKVKAHRQCIRIVEARIREQLICENTETVKDGLSNVLYWGFATQRGRQIDRVQIFRNKVKDFQIDRFKSEVRNLSGPRLASIRGRVNNKNDNMPQFTMMSFVSKVMMFLDPGNYPVLDKNIAKFAKSEHFPILANLKIGTAIAITGDSESMYENWAAWCRGIAHLVNDKSSTSLRAVDVERGLYQFIGSDKDRRTDTQRKNDRVVAQKLLRCPEGWTHDGVMALGRQTDN